MLRRRDRRAKGSGAGTTACWRAFLINLFFFLGVLAYLLFPDRVQRFVPIPFSFADRAQSRARLARRHGKRSVAQVQGRLPEGAALSGAPLAARKANTTPD